MKIKSSNKKIWWLFLIFIITFCFGDIASTLVVLKIQPEVTISDKCNVKLPPECEVNPIIQKSPTLITMIGLKLIIALIFFLLVLFIKQDWVGYTMIILSILGLFAVINNLSIYYWKLAPFFFYPLIIFSIFMMHYFTKPRWEAVRKSGKAM